MLNFNLNHSDENFSNIDDIQYKFFTCIAWQKLFYFSIEMQSFFTETLNSLCKMENFLKASLDYQQEKNALTDRNVLENE